MGKVSPVFAADACQYLLDRASADRVADVLVADGPGVALAPGAIEKPDAEVNRRVAELDTFRRETGVPLQRLDQTRALFVPRMRGALFGLPVSVVASLYRVAPKYLLAWSEKSDNVPFVTVPKDAAAEILLVKPGLFASAFRLSKRTADGIRHHECESLGEFIQVGSYDLSWTPSFGAKSWAELMDKLGRIGLWTSLDIEWSGARPEDGIRHGLQVFAPRFVPPVDVLNKRLEELSVNTTSLKRLHASRIVFLGDVVQRTAVDLVDNGPLDSSLLPTFMSLAYEHMRPNGLRFGMKVGPWTHEEAQRAA